MQRVLILVSVVVIGAAVPLTAADRAPDGPQFQVNQYTTGNQDYGAVARTTDGGFLVVWQSQGSAGSDSDGPSIQGRRYSSDGAPLGPQIQVNTFTTSWQRHPAVAADPNGSFVVVWDSDGSFGSDSDGFSVQARLLNADGVPSGPEFQVNTSTTRDAEKPAVAIGADGRIVVTWSRYAGGSETRVEGQRLEADGTQLGPEFFVANAYTTTVRCPPAVAVAPDGGFTILWMTLQTCGASGQFFEIDGQRYDANGTPQGGCYQVNTYTTGEQGYPSLAIDADGIALASWDSAGSNGTDSDGKSIQAQRFTSGGAPVGDELQLNTYTTGSQSFPHVARDPSGGHFLATWHSEGSYGSDTDSTSVQSLRVATSGAILGDELQINTYTTSGQWDSQAALGRAGEAVVVWTSIGSSGSDSDGYSMQGQRLTGYPQLVNGVPEDGVVPPIYPHGAWRFAYADLGEGMTDLVVDLYNLTGDLDLYVRRGLKPNLTLFDCRPQVVGSGPEQCVFAEPEPGRWWVGIYNHDISTIGFTVEASWDEGAIFADGFESGDTSAWSDTVGGS